jgi:hypothetical protein
MMTCWLKAGQKSFVYITSGFPLFSKALFCWLLSVTWTACVNDLISLLFGFILGDDLAALLSRHGGHGFSLLAGWH